VAPISERVWLESNLDERHMSKARTRELTYRALIQFLESYSPERS
jgi:hypothetical protein